MTIPKLFITDCEGPLSKNDNAYEFSKYLIPDGDRFFTLISKYDDVQADVLKKPGYEAGDTLKLILPFLKAYGATNEVIRRFSANHLLLVPGAYYTLQHVKQFSSSFIISTSYEQYLEALCNVVNFPFQNVYCTRLNIDQYAIGFDVGRLKQLRKEIATTHIINIPEKAWSINDFTNKDQQTIRRLDEIFWGEIPKMKCGKIFEDVKPIGGSEKAKAVQDALKKTECNIYDVMYVGDSITDVQSFQLLRKNGGVTVSFNGNRYAIREAEIAVLSKNTIVTSVLAEVFNNQGRTSVLELVDQWSHSSIEQYCTNATLCDKIFKLYPKILPQVEIITSSSRERLIEESSIFRQNVRGEAIGRLG